MGLGTYLAIMKYLDQWTVFTTELFEQGVLQIKLMANASLASRWFPPAIVPGTDMWGLD